MKKFLAIMLTVCLLAGMFTFAAVADSATLDVAGATIINDGFVALHFTEAVTCENFAGPYFIAAFKQVNALTTAMKGNEGTCARVGLSYSGISSDKKTVYLSGSGLLDMYNRTGAWANYANDTAYEFVIGVDGQGIEGQAYTIKSFDGAKSLRSFGNLVHPGLATIPYNASTNITVDANWKQTEHSLTITDAVILNDTDVILNFSEPIALTVNAWGTYGAWIVAYEDANGNRIGRTGVSADYVSSDLRTVKLTVPNAKDWFNAEGSFAAYAGSTPIVGVDGVTGQWSAGYVGGIDSVHPASNPAINMAPTKYFGNSGGGEGLHCAYTSEIKIDENYLYPNPTAEDLQLTEAIIINDNQLIAHFSEPIAVIEPWTVTYKMVYINSNNAITEEYYLSAAVIGDMSTMRLDLADTSKTMAEIINDEAHAEDELWFVVEEVLDNGDKLCGGVEKIEALATPGKQLAATVMKLNGSDSAWIPVSVDYEYMLPMDADVSEDFHIVSATAINEKQIVIEFSEPVHLEAPYAYIALRYTDESGYLMMDGATPLQFDGSAVVSGDGMRITWTINETGNIAGCNNVLDAINFKGDLAKYKNYRAMMCIEEIVDNPDDNATVSHVFNDAGKELAANRIYDIGRDAAYVRVVENTEWEDPGLLPLEIPAMPKGPHIVKAVAVNDKQLVVEFSEPVTFVDPYGFMSIRYVDRNFNLGFDGKDPLQFYGSAVVSLDRKSVVWTLADEGNIGNVDNLADILNRTGKLAKYKDYYPVFGLEEITANGKGDKDALIENVVNDKGEKVVANCPTDLGYDRVYVSISVDTKYKIPDTSDNVNVYLLCAGLAVSVILAGAVVIKRKRTQA